MESSPVALIRSSRPSFWKSCIPITNALEAAYREAFADAVQLFYYEDDTTDEALTHLVAKLIELSPREIVFLDHYPSYTRFISTLDSLTGEGHRLPLVMHAYGDFTYYCQEYLRLENILKKHPLKIYGASSKSSAFIGQHIQQQSVVSTLPFAILPSAQTTQNDFKVRYSLTDEQFIVCYTGRLSTQKNTLQLLTIMTQFLTEHTNAVFFMAGSFDNYGTTYVGLDEEPGEFEQKFNSAMAAIPQSLKSRIHYVSNLNKPELDQLYQAADLYISLSLYHNEDFGMAPLEAATHGCALLLSDWGGFNDFKLAQGPDCLLVKVALTETGLRIDSSEVLAGLKQQLMTAKENRTARAQKYIKHFSVLAAAMRLKDEIRRPHGVFQGFSHVPRMYFWINQGMTKLIPKKGTAYEQLYRSYFE